MMRVVCLLRVNVISPLVWEFQRGRELESGECNSAFDLGLGMVDDSAIDYHFVLASLSLCVPLID